MTALEQLINRLIRPILCERDVFEAAVERVVVADGCVVDAEGGVDRGGDVLGADVAIRAPAVVADAAACSVGFPDYVAAADAAAGPDRGHAQIVIAAGLVI